MKWPDDIIEPLEKAMNFELIGLTKRELVDIFLSMVMEQAIDRYGHNPEKISGYIEMPPTIIGGIFPLGLVELEGVESFHLGPEEWKHWSVALDRIYAFVKSNAKQLVEDFKG